MYCEVQLAKLAEASGSASLCVFVCVRARARVFACVYVYARMCG